MPPLRGQRGKPFSLTCTNHPNVWYLNIIIMKQKIRIAAGQGFWGDLPDAPVRQVEGGPIDYLMLDYLAEVTMSIMQKQKSRDPNAGYAKDFVPLMKQILPACVERNIRVTANAGGVNVEGCANAVSEVARELGLGGKVSHRNRHRRRHHAATGRIAGSRNRVAQHGHGRAACRLFAIEFKARMFISARRRWLKRSNRGAQIVITGRATDTGLTLAP